VSGSERPLSSAALVEVALAQRDAALGAMVQLNASTAREESFAGSAVQWERFGLGVGPRYSLPVTSGALEVGALALGGLLHTGGLGYASDQSNTGFDYGAELCVRWTWWREGVGPWVGADGRAWLRTQQVFIGGAPGLLTLPRFEVALSLGAQWAGL
jgi:hypothetical protein